MDSRSSRISASSSISPYSSRLQSSVVPGYARNPKFLPLPSSERLSYASIDYLPTIAEDEEDWSLP